MRKINISIDDVSPHPMSSTRVLAQCKRVLESFPTAKFTLFVPLAYWRTQGHTATNGPLPIHEFPTFCQELLSLPKETFELAFHGLHHGIPGRSNNDELQSVDLQEARGIIGEMIQIASKAGLIVAFKRVLRPPAWRMSPDAFQAAAEVGIRTFALSPDDYAMQTYAGAQSGKRVVYYDCCPPFKPLRLGDRVEVVYHACEWDRNYMSKELTDDLISFLSTNEFEFVFIEDLIDGEV